jgi:hypothetical protein
MMPVHIRGGVPICPDICCDEPMVQVAAPDDQFPGGQWQCPAGARELEEMRGAIGRWLDNNPDWP